MPYLRDWLSQGDLALDVGANLGSYTFELSRITRNVIAFEPNVMMAKAIKSLRLHGVSVRNEAASDTCGTATLYLPVGQKHVLASIEQSVVRDETCTEVKVATVTLDSLGLHNIRFIKIDVEGAEERVLHGAWQTIAAQKPILLIEIEERHNQGGLDRISRKLTSIGYQGFFFSGTWRPLSEFSVREHQDASVLSNPTVFYTSRNSLRQQFYVPRLVARRYLSDFTAFGLLRLSDE